MENNYKIGLLDKFDTDKNMVVSKEEQHTNLSSNNVGLCCSSLDITDKEGATDVLLDELAGIFVESILWELDYGKQPEKGSHLLQGINKGAS